MKVAILVRNIAQLAAVSDALGGWSQAEQASQGLFIESFRYDCQDEMIANGGNDDANPVVLDVAVRRAVNFRNRQLFAGFRFDARDGVVEQTPVAQCDSQYGEQAVTVKNYR